MDGIDLAKLAQGGFGLALLGLLYVVGMRVVRALDGVVATITAQHETTRRTIDEHTSRDLEAQGLVVERLARIEGAMGIDEVRIHSGHTPIQGVPSGLYGLKRRREDR